MDLKKIFFTVSLVYFFLFAKAQFSDSVFHYAGYSSSGTFNRTNLNRSYLINNTLKLGMKKKNVTINSSNKWLYGEQNYKLVNNDVSSSWDFNLYKTLPHFYYWGLFNYNSSYSLKINNQLQSGLGIAYNVIDRADLALNLSEGILYDYNDVTLKDTTRQVYGTSRNSFRIQLKWNLKNKLIFRGNTFIQNSLDYGNDYIFKAEASLSVKIKKWLSITSAFNYNKISRTQTENLFLTYGLTIEHYF